ncbi:MAG: leucyl/phenylalanyl-tRNA--protein transferase [Bradymonadaceae bacterium]
MLRPSVDMLIAGYAQGVFPMAHPDEGNQIYWYAPDPRGLLPIEEFHCPDRLAQTVRQEPYDIRVDTAFEAVMRGCAEPRSPANQTTWISEGIIDAYTELHRRGVAHSVEAWEGDELVGGLYGVALGGLFAGESMFYRATDASKICLVHLVERLEARGFEMLDVQWVTAHLEQFGAYEIPREEYEARSRSIVQMDVSFA